MAYRLYLSGIIGDGLTPETAFRSQFVELCRANGVTEYYQYIDAQEMGFAISVANLDDTTHNIFVADPLIRHLPKSFLDTQRQNLTQEQVTKLNEILTYFGYSGAGSIFTQTATVRDLIYWMLGRKDWDGWRSWDPNATD